MLFSFVCQKKFLIKTILLTKYTGILYRLIGIFYFKILYNGINWILKSLVTTFSDRYIDPFLLLHPYDTLY